MRKFVIDNATGLIENCIEADDSFVKEGKTLIEDIGQAKVGDTYDFDTQIFTPKPDYIPTWEDVIKLQKKLLSSDTNVAWRIARYGTQQALTGKTPKETAVKYQELLQYCQDVRDADETNHATPQLALDALNALTIPS